MESQQQKTLFVLGTLFVVTCIGLGTGMYFAGYYAYHSPETQIDIADDLMNEISAEKISEYLKHLSSVPHLAGTAQDKEQAEWIKQNFLDFGLDDAVLVPYNVLLSYPNKTQANKVSLLNDTGILLETQAKQKPLYGEEEASDLIVSNFNAYSAPGIVQRDSLVYIYYGRTADFDFIQSQGIDITDKIVMARYGQEFSGTIAQTAEKRGAAGVLLFSDPQDFALEGRNQSYPDTFWMPGTATRFGFLYMDNGDPLTPFYPAIESAHRITINSGICPVSRCSVLPKIPVQVVSYNEAEVLLQAIGGMPSPSEWQGDLDADYNLGPNLKDNLQVKMEVYTTNQMATTYNTIGILRGEIEPDRYVLVGNHRDAWTLGAVDPSSGTAAMLEIARAFGKMKRDHGWKPRRTIVFCSWGAEEYGLIGSYEWVEQNSKVLSQRAVAYLNVDIAVQGNYTLRGTAAPLLHDVLVQSAKKVPTPDPSEVALGRNTFFDTWRNRSQDPSHPEFPRINILGVDSDFSGFMHVIGVPSVDLRHTHNEPVPSYPLYHTLYESYHLLADIIDQGFNYHRAMARLWAEVARTLTESHVLPFDIRWYAAFLQKVFVDIQTRYGTQLAANGASLDFFKAAVDKFDNDTKSFAEMLKNLDTNQNVLAVRRVNDQLMQLERHFIEPQGLPGHPEWNHIILAPTSSETYTSTGFPGLTDLLDLVGNDTEAQRPLEWAQIKQHIGVIAFRVQEAGNSLVHESIVC